MEGRGDLDGTIVVGKQDGAIVDGELDEGKFVGDEVDGAQDGAVVDGAIVDGE